jgi:8-oxo-dGTP pyrophosphatase MutT (NUDIX family)
MVDIRHLEIDRIALDQQMPDWRTWTRAAAVVLHLAPLREADWRVLLIWRPGGMREHGGQVACPGGGFDPKRDADLWQTAVRESEEEVGLKPRDEQRLGYLEPIYVAASGYTVLPCVVAWPFLPTVKAAPREVEDWRWVSLEELKTVEGRVWRRGEWVPDYPLAWRRVWGATARMLYLLILAIEQA